MTAIRHTAVCLIVSVCGLIAFAQSNTNGNRFTRRPLTALQKAEKDAIPEWRPKITRAYVLLPDAVDNSELKYFPEVFNQGSNNSCSQASGVRYAFTYEVNRLLGRDASDPANVFCYHFTWNFLNEGSNLGSHAFLGYELMKECGAVNLLQMEDKAYSFAQQTQWLSGYQTYLDAMRYRVGGYCKFNLKTREGIDLLRQYIYDHGDCSECGGIAVISSQTDDWGLRSYSGPCATGLRHIVTKNGADGPHAITITGYDDAVEYDFDNNGIISDNERGAFIFVNSWGEEWASGGKCYIPYSVLLASPEDGGLSEGDSDAYMVTPAIGDPRIVFYVKLEYNRRNELSFILGAADGEGATHPTVEMVYPIMNRQGGAEPMQGYKASSEMEVAFNFSRFYDVVSTYENPKFFLFVRRTAASGTGKLIDFSVLDLTKGVTYMCNQHNVNLNGGQLTMATGSSASVYPSCSKWKWLIEGTYAPVSSPFIVKTAAGRPHKMMIQGYDHKSGRLTIRHRRI